MCTPRQAVGSVLTFLVALIWERCTETAVVLLQQHAPLTNNGRILTAAHAPDLGYSLHLYITIDRGVTCISASIFQRETGSRVRDNREIVCDPTLHGKHRQILLGVLRR